MRLYLTSLLVTVLAARAGEPAFDEYQVKAAFLYNFAKFVEWPPGTFANSNDPIGICIVGQNPFGSTLEDMVDLALWLKQNGRRPRQVQDFIPTPMSLAATMYWTGLDPLAMETVYTARGLREKKLQKALILYWDREQWPMVREALSR